VNPIGKGLKSARVDMGVDYTGSGPLYAMGSGTITSVSNSGWPGGTFIGLHLDSGQYMYYAENIAPAVHIGQRVSAGQLVGTARGSYPFIEVGWAAPPGTGNTMASQAGQAATGGDPGAHATAYGESMSNLIKSLGGPPGITSGSVVGSVPSDYYSASPGAATSGASSGAGCLPMIYFAYVIWGFLCRVANTKENNAAHATPQNNGPARFAKLRKLVGARKDDS
jgi:hypothetical protein